MIYCILICLGNGVRLYDCFVVKYGIKHKTLKIAILGAIYTVAHGESF